MSAPARLMPQSPDAEMGILGSMLIGGPEIVEEMDSRLTGDYFYVPRHSTIFATLVAMNRARNPVDFITLTEQLRLGEMLEEVGGPAFLTELHCFVPSAANVDFYARIVREKFLLRRMIQIGTQFGRRAYEEQDDVQQLLEEFQGELIEVGQLETDANSLRHIKEDLSEGLDRVEERYHKRGKLDGLSTGFTDVDRMLDGLKPACVYVLAGRPAMGKTAAGGAIAEHVVLEHRARMKAGEKIERPGVAVFDLEMTRGKRVDRIFAAHAEVTREKLRRGFLSAADMANLHKTVKDFSEAQLFLDASAGLTITKFKAQARRAVVKFKCGLIIVDYVQIMKGVTKRSKDNRSLEIAEVMAGIAETAKALMVPIIVLAQIGRSAEEKQESRPSMADLKESGAIEEYADVVILLYRPIYYAKSASKRKKLINHFMENKGLEYGQAEAYAERYAEWVIDKNRDGAVGTVGVRFVGEFTRFEDPSGRPLYSNNPNQRQPRTDE